jgi:hypothetical protein
MNLRTLLLNKEEDQRNLNLTWGFKILSLYLQQK